MRRTPVSDLLFIVPGTGRKLSLWEELGLCVAAANEENPLFQIYYLLYLAQGGISASERNLVSVPLLPMRRTPRFRSIIYHTWHRAEARPLRGTWSLCRCCQWGERRVSDRWCTGAASACPILNNHSLNVYLMTQCLNTGILNPNYRKAKTILSSISIFPSLIPTST